MKRDQKGGGCFTNLSLPWTGLDWIQDGEDPNTDTQILPFFNSSIWKNLKYFNSLFLSSSSKIHQISFGLFCILFIIPILWFLFHDYSEGKIGVPLPKKTWVNEEDLVTFKSIFLNKTNSSIQPKRLKISARLSYFCLVSSFFM